MSLTFKRLREKNVLRNLILSDRGAFAACKNWTPSQWLQALVGEVGEYANWRKKYERGDLTIDEFKKEAGKELADIQAYLDLLAANLDIDLEEVTIAKFNEVSNKHGVDIKL